MWASLTVYCWLSATDDGRRGVRREGWGRSKGCYLGLWSHYPCPPAPARIRCPVVDACSSPRFVAPGAVASWSSDGPPPFCWQLLPGWDLSWLSPCSWGLCSSVVFEFSSSCSIQANFSHSLNQWPPALLPSPSLVLTLEMILRPAHCRSVAILHKGILNITYRASQPP